MQVSDVNRLDTIEFMQGESGTEAHQLDIAATTASIRAARAFVLAAARGRPGVPLADLALATSELVTNAVEHGTGSLLEVAVHHVDGGLLLTVTSDSDDLPQPRRDLAPVDALDGRGLRVVSALADNVAISARNGQVTVACRFAIDD